ncbi:MULTISPECIES: AAA family ATPase [Paenibacillus]|uniref:ATP-binding protein n=1 Tax=Paenibacillus xylanilyticus TaxID=248903 RepID=A0A7Y6BZU6_9BACL|nr:AAA family ATPase [Paenibacillus xylanilyticus]NUU77583.1 ATP-binding protein [Paenibacillus xylanilyticus]
MTVQKEKAIHTQAIYIYDNQQDDQIRIQGYATYARLIRGIIEALNSRYGVHYELFASDDPNNEYWELLKEDLLSDSTEVELVARIFEDLELRTLHYEDDGDVPTYGVHYSIRNNVFAYPKWGVALVRIPFFRDNGIYNEDFVFAVGEEELKQFLGSVRERERQQNMKKVTVYTDARNGSERHVESITRSVGRDDVVLSAQIKQDIFRSLDQFFEADRSFYREYDIPYKRGILLYGHPGNGKTTLVKSIAGSIPGPAAYWQITEYTNSESVREVFEAAKRLAPMVLIIEDIDSMPDEVRSFFLNTLDGATSKEGIFLIGTTNYPEKIDPGLMNRAGRFDRAYEIPLPDEALRLQYLQQRGFHVFAGEEGTHEAARLTDTFSLAQLGELYVSAALEWHQNGQTDIVQVIQSMRGELDKSHKHNWLTQPGKGRAGFY